MATQTPTEQAPEVIAIARMNDVQFKLYDNGSVIIWEGPARIVMDEKELVTFLSMLASSEATNR